LGDQAQTADVAIQAKLAELRTQWDNLQNEFDAARNESKQRDDERDRCFALPVGTADERKAKYQCIYERQKAALAFLKNRILALQKAIEFHKIQILILVRLARDQFATALAIPAVAGVDTLKAFRDALVNKLQQLVELTLTIEKISVKLEVAILNREKAVQFVENVKARADEIIAGTVRTVNQAIADIKQKVEDYKTAIRDFARTYIKNALECKVVITNTDNTSKFVVSCAVELKAGETKDSIKTRFQQEVAEIINSQTGVEVVVKPPVDIVDPELQPQSAKRGVLQNNAPLSSEATVGQEPVQSTTVGTLPSTTGDASSAVVSITMLVLALIALLF